MTQKLTTTQMEEAGMPDWMVERITTCCIHCDLWDKQCNAGMFCKITVNREASPYGDIEYYFSINFWIIMQKIRMETSK